MFFQPFWVILCQNLHQPLSQSTILFTLYSVTSRKIWNFSCKRSIHLRIGSIESLKRTGSYEFPICSRIGHPSRLGVECSEHVFINTSSVCTLSRSVAHSLCVGCRCFIHVFYFHVNNMWRITGTTSRRFWCLCDCSLERGKVGLIHRMYGSDSCVANTHWIKLSTGTNALM